MRLPNLYLFSAALCLGIVITLCVMQYYHCAPWHIYGQYR